MRSYFVSFRVASWFRLSLQRTGTTNSHEATLTRICLTGFVLLGLLAWASCDSAAEKGDVLLAKDPQARAEIERLNALLATKRPVTRIDVESLDRLREKYPGSATISRLLQNAYIKRGDWLAAEQLIAAVPESARTDVDRLDLAKVQIKQGKFAEAAALLRSINTTGPEQVEVPALLAQAEFYSGNLAESVNRLAPLLPRLVEQKRAEDVTLLGTAYHRQGDNAKAIETLKTAVTIAPDNIAATSALGRAYAATGDQANAEATRVKVEELSVRLAEEEKRKSRQVALFYQLEDAYAAKDHDRVVSLVNQIRPEADRQTMAVLHQYLAAVYKAQGKEAEANRELEEAARIVQK